MRLFIPYPLDLSKLSIEADRVICKEIYEETTGEDEEFAEDVSDWLLED